MSFIKKHKNDILLIAIVLVLALGIWAYTLLTRQSGGEAVVSINGEEVLRLPLNKDTRVTLGEGEHTNVLVIEKGEAAVIEASCPDHVCIDQGRVRFSGQSIVCLPNKLVVSIEGGADPAVDGVAG